MVQRYLFFNSKTGDRRRYQAQDFAEYFGSILSTGLLYTDTELPGLVVSAEQGTMNTVVSYGKAIMGGHLYENTTPSTLEHRIPEPDADRIDRVILRLDMRQSGLNILLHIIEGDADYAPELQRDNSIYEISLAQIRVRANTSSIDPEDIRDERLDEDLCGLVRLRFPINLDGFVTQEEKGQPNGIPFLNENGVIPKGQIPDMDYVHNDEKGAPGGVATLDGSGKIPIAQLPEQGPTYIETTRTASFPPVVSAGEFTNVNVLIPIPPTANEIHLILVNGDEVHVLRGASKAFVRPYNGNNADAPEVVPINKGLPTKGPQNRLASENPRLFDGCQLTDVFITGNSLLVKSLNPTSTAKNNVSEVFRFFAR